MNTYLQILFAFFSAGILRLTFGVVDGSDPRGSSLEELTELRSKKLKKLNAILADPLGVADDETRTGDLTADQLSQHDTLDAEIRSLDVRIVRLQKAEDRAAEQKELERRSLLRGTPRVVADPANSGTTPGERRDAGRFSLGRALRLASEGRSLDGPEAEFIAEGANEARDSGITVQSNAIMVSSIALSGGMEARDQTATGTANLGGNLVQTSVGTLLDALFERLAFSRMGNVDLNTGLVGNLTINRIVRGTAPADKAENATADEHAITFEPHTLTPRRTPTFMNISKQLFIQSSERNLERRITNHVLSEVRVKMELSYVLDILGTAGIGAVVGGTNGATPSYADIVNIAGKLTDANVDPDMIQYLINTAVESYLMTAPKAVDGNGDSVDSVKVLSEASDRLAGRRYQVSNVVPSNLTKGTADGVASAIIAGDFSGYSIGQFSGLEFLIDPFTAAKTGMNVIHCAIYHDGVVNDPAKFAAMKDALTA